jgi:hypothetical protein
MLRDFEEATGNVEVREETWRVETAWLAVLAGDIDDLEQHLLDSSTANHNGRTCHCLSPQRMNKARA